MYEAVCSSYHIGRAKQAYFSTKHQSQGPRKFSRWVNVLYDEQMTAALIGRLIHDCHLILFPGENNRIRESSINSMYAKVSDTKS